MEEGTTRSLLVKRRQDDVDGVNPIITNDAFEPTALPTAPPPPPPPLFFSSQPLLPSLMKKCRKRNNSNWKSWVLESKTVTTLGDLIFRSRKGEKMAADESSCSMSDPCPICLGPILQESYLDHCFHKFCYNCIMRWAKVVASKHSRLPSSVKCPLCKTENFSIIHGYDGNSFQRHYVNQDFGSCAFFSEAHKYRLQCYYIEPDRLINTFKVPQYRKSRKYFQSNQGLQGWLRREIQALLQEEDVEIIVHHILGVIDSLRRNDQKSPSITETREENFKALVCEAARPFLTGRTDQFVHELELFLASGLNIDAYDKVYMQRLGWKPPGITSEEVDGESIGNAPLVPFLYFFDDSDGNE